MMEQAEVPELAVDEQTEMEYSVPEEVRAMCPECGNSQNRINTEGKLYAEWREGEPLNCLACSSYNGPIVRSAWQILDNGRWCCAWEITLDG